MYAYRSDPEVCRYQSFEPGTLADVEAVMGTPGIVPLLGALADTRAETLADNLPDTRPDALVVPPGGHCRRCRSTCRSRRMGA